MRAAPPGVKVLSVLYGSVELLVSVPLMLEYDAVLTRHEHRLASGLDAWEMNEILDAFAVVAVRVALRFLWRRSCGVWHHGGDAWRIPEGSTTTKCEK